MSVLQFPGGRPVPPRTAVDTLLGEVAQVELELARARLAQINQETRQAAALWGWWCFKRALVWGLMLWIVVTIAKADERKQFYGPNGQFQGSSITRGPSAQYYTGSGSFSGSSVKIGPTTNYYDFQGRFSGSTTERK